jgi:hypothetical protein
MKHTKDGMTMVKKDGKMVPDFAADGKGKMKKGGDVGMHRMPDGSMMKDSAHKGMKAGGMMKYKMGGAVRGDGCAVKGKTRGRMI